MIMAALCRDAATGQVTPVNTTTQQNANGTMITGDTMFVAFTKVNGSMLFLGTLASNNIAALNTVSNAVNALQVGGLNFVIVSNNFRVVSNAWAAFAADVTSDSGGNVTMGGNLTVGGSIFGAYLLDSYSDSYGVSAGMVATSLGSDGSWQWQAPSSFPDITDSGGNVGVNNNLVVNGNLSAATLSDSYGSTPAYGMVATSVGTDGTWQWMTPPTLPSTLSFDGGSITSDGSGDATFVSIYAQQLKDSSSWTGSAGYYAQANGSGGWAWTEWPYTLSYDGGAVYSDGSGNLYATALKAELWDSGYSSGGSGQTPTANGDGTWTWQTPPTAMVSGGGGGGGGTMNFDGGSITSDGGGDVTIGGTASFMGGQTVIDYGSGGVQLKINGGSGYQSGGAQIDVAGTVCMTAGGEVDVGNGGSFTDPSPGVGYDVKCGGAAGGITSIGQINANGGYLINNQTLVDSSRNVTAASVQAQLRDRNSSSGAGGQVATAQGGGTWLWQTPQTVFTNAHGARFGLMVDATTNGFVFVPVP